MAEERYAAHAEFCSGVERPIPLTYLSRQVYRAVIAKGHGGDDICCSIRLMEDLESCEGLGGSK
jgi:hypothetical protein